jgi:hypothetical protein
VTAFLTFLTDAGEYDCRMETAAGTWIKTNPVAFLKLTGERSFRRLCTGINASLPVP